MTCNKLSVGSCDEISCKIQPDDKSKVNAFDGCFKWPIYTKLMGAYTFYIATAITFTAINLDQLTDLEHFQGKFDENFRTELWSFFSITKKTNYPS